MAENGQVKDFDAEMDLENKPGHVFRLAGRDWNIKGYAPPAAFLESEDARSNLLHFVETLMVPDDRDAFKAMMDDPDAPVDYQQVPAISNWIVEQISGRPTASPAPSGPGPGETSTTSPESSPSPVTAGDN